MAGWPLDVSTLTLHSPQVWILEFLHVVGSLRLAELQVVAGLNLPPMRPFDPLSRSSLPFVGKNSGLCGSDGDLGSNLDDAIGRDLEIRGRILGARREEYEQALLPARQLRLGRHAQGSPR